MKPQTRKLDYTIKLARVDEQIMTNWGRVFRYTNALQKLQQRRKRLVRLIEAEALKAKEARVVKRPKSNGRVNAADPPVAQVPADPDVRALRATKTPAEAWDLAAQATKTPEEAKAARDARMAAAGFRKVTGRRAAKAGN